MITAPFYRLANSGSELIKFLGPQLVRYRTQIKAFPTLKPRALVFSRDYNCLDESREDMWLNKFEKP